MKIDFKALKHKDKMYGTTTVGSRGQVVIPAQARKDLGIKPGDRLVVLGKFDKVLGMIKSERLDDIINAIVDSITGLENKQEALRHIKRMLEPLKSSK